MDTNQRENSKLKEFLKKIYKLDIFGIIIVVILEFVILAVLSPNFLTKANLLGIAKSISINGMVALGMTLIVISGELDLSVGSTLAFGGMVTAFSLTYLKLGTAPSILIGLVSGALFGYIISLFVNKLKINSIIVSLGFLYLIRSGVYFLKFNKLVTGYANIAITDKFVKWLGQANIGSIPVIVIFFIVFIILAIFFLNFTATGKFIYATGGNNRAAKLSGVNTENIKTLGFIITGLLAAFAGILTIGKTGSAELIAGTGAELEIIAAVVIGGNLLSGGKGSMVGTIIGVIIMGLLKNAFIMLKFSVAAQIMGVGVLVIIAVVLDSFRRKR